ncbi:hypothetical protein AB9K17_23490, partial [Salmonella enterica subsp. enterica serovar Kentucky]|uniref:hypothetical protein n=1 Tax=Salmonella enterica TaxID=28901 RepID=UPI003F4B01A4
GGARMVIIALSITYALLDHILNSHYHELHLEQVSLLDSSNLIIMLSDLHLDTLSKFKGILHH